MAGIGVGGDDNNNGLENQRSALMSNVNKASVSKRPLTTEAAELRGHDEREEAGNDQINFNGATGKCVTLQQYKGQGAPKYMLLPK